ncbi:hypothetical protein [Mucilaginibacter defluvii]|uniref:NmrA-like family protein n=1 Tax=Mucilaginibacter defluvii TaxID=1196019 RepID=A0ABP9FVC6_9SPHI
MTGSPSGVPWIDSKLVLKELFRKYLPGTMIILPALYMEHIGSQLLKVSGKVIKGRFGADARVPYIALQDIGISAAWLFDAPDTYKGTKQVLAGDLVTGNELAAMLSGLAGDRHFSYQAQFGLVSASSGRGSLRCAGFSKRREDGFLRKMFPVRAIRNYRQNRPGSKNIWEKQHAGF